MSKEQAERFVGSWHTDPRIKEAIAGLGEQEHDSIEAIVAVASRLGYDVTPIELAEALVARSAASRVVASSEELSEEELEQISGGMPQCSNDYTPGESCWYDDRCFKAVNYYKKNTLCATTYFQCMEDCTFSDECVRATNSYDHTKGTSLERVNR